MYAAGCASRSPISGATSAAGVRLTAQRTAILRDLPWDPILAAQSDLDETES